MCISVCLSVCVPVESFGVERCTKRQPHQRDWGYVKGRFMTVPFRGRVWGVQSTHMGRGWLWMESSVQNQSERGWWWWWGGHKRHPQKLFDSSHQRAILTCLTLHFQLSVKSSAWGCHSLHGRSTSSPAALFDRSHGFACVFKGTRFLTTCWGLFLRRQEISFCDLLQGNNGQLKQEQWPTLVHPSTKI